MDHEHQPCKVLFVFPPAYYPWFVVPGLAYLSGYLERGGFKVETFDANVAGLEHLLVGHSQNPTQTREALGCLRDERKAKDWRAYADAMRHLSDCARAVSERNREKLTFTRNTLRYKPAFETRSRAGLLEAARRCDEHLYARFYTEELFPLLRRLRPAVVALSASDLHQLLPATVLAAMMRRDLGDSSPKRLIGGNVFSRIYPALTAQDSINWELHDIWGDVIVGEGEYALSSLVGALREGRVAGEMEGQVRPGVGVYKRRPPIDLNDLGAPRCDGFRPLTPRLPVPLNIYRGCYYSGGCSFCDINHGYDSVWASDSPKLGKGGRRLRDLKLVVTDIRHCVERYGTDIFNFTDEWFRAKDMVRLSELLLADGRKISWDAYCRLEPELARPEVAALLAKAGARFFQFGLESASIKTLRAVGKGTAPDTSARVLRNLAGAGIWNHLFLIVGLPGERLHETLLTIAFVVEHADSIFTIKPTRFQLSRHSPLSTAAGGRHIDVQAERDAEFDIALNRPFQYRPRKLCVRCGSRAKVEREKDTCGRCQDRLVLRPLISRHAVNVIYIATELVAAQHWAYPFTSLYPYHTRLMFTHEEVRRVVEEREVETDRNVGLPPAKVRETLQLLCRFLQWEARHSVEVSELYERTGLECPAELTTVGELIAFARELKSCSMPEAVRPDPVGRDGAEVAQGAEVIHS
jgi:radical SAM superfamily enzyme YgiQ (UPF0313 family)